MKVWLEPRAYSVQMCSSSKRGAAQTYISSPDVATAHNRRRVKVRGVIFPGSSPFIQSLNYLLCCDLCAGQLKFFSTPTTGSIFSVKKYCKNGHFEQPSPILFLRYTFKLLHISQISLAPFSKEGDVNIVSVTEKASQCPINHRSTHFSIRKCMKSREIVNQ